MKNKNKKIVLVDIKEKTNNCLSSRKHANDILEIIAKLQDDEESVVMLCMRSVHKLFSHYLQVGEMVVESRDVDQSERSKEDQYKGWLLERYRDTVERLAEMLLHKHTDIQELALSVLMKLLVKESKFPLGPSASISILKKMLSTMLSDTVNNQTLLNRFGEYVAYDDIRFYTLKHLHALFSRRGKQEMSQVLLGNIFAVLENISIPKVDKTELLTNFLCSEAGIKVKVKTVSEHRKLYTTIWVEFLTFELSATLYKRVLVIIHDKVMPNLSTPLVLSDFLTQCYNIGGAISLLALNGLFILIQKHNLHYPDFYTKLYALFEPSVFHVKYKARFFYLCDLFLSSTHLPSYLVAAFAKKLARISLTAPPAGTLVAVPFIYNLIIRHPSCKQLIHRPDVETDYESDPYDLSEPDPAKCRALESSLWELKTLQYHYHPDVFKIAKKMDQGIPDMEIDLIDSFDLTANDLYEKEVLKKQKTMAVTFEPAKGLLCGQDDKLGMFWRL